jgi:hypothetical protein
MCCTYRIGHTNVHICYMDNGYLVTLWMCAFVYMTSCEHEGAGAGVGAGVRVSNK